MSSMREFVCPQCSMPFVVRKVKNIWECKCTHCKLFIRMKLPKLYEAVDAFCFAIDHLHGVRYRFVEVVTDYKIDITPLAKIEPGLAYLVTEIAAELKCTEQHAEGMLWRAFQETGKLKRKRIKGKTYWLFLEVVK